MPIGPVSPVVPPIDGVTRAEGRPPGLPTDSIGMLATILGRRPDSMESSGDKMAKVVQLLREISASDPRIAALASEALQMLVSGPPAFAGGAPSGPVSPGGGGSLLVGSPSASA